MKGGLVKRKSSYNSHLPLKRQEISTKQIVSPYCVNKKQKIPRRIQDDINTLSKKQKKLSKQGDRAGYASTKENSRSNIRSNYTPDLRDSHSTFSFEQIVTDGQYLHHRTENQHQRQVNLEPIYLQVKTVLQSYNKILREANMSIKKLQKQKAELAGQLKKIKKSKI